MEKHQTVRTLECLRSSGVCVFAVFWLYSTFTQVICTLTVGASD